MLLLLCASTCGVVLWAYWRRPPASLVLSGGRLRRDPVDSALGKAYDWIRASTPANSIFLVDGGMLSNTVLGNVPEFPALAERVVFVAPQPDYMVSLYPDAATRRDIVREVVSGQMLAETSRRYLAALGRPVHVVVDDRLGGGPAGMQATYGTPEFRDGSLAVFKVID
jgi:hypothetical protein